VDNLHFKPVTNYLIEFEVPGAVNVFQQGSRQGNKFLESLIQQIVRVKVKYDPLRKTIITYTKVSERFDRLEVRKLQHAYDIMSHKVILCNTLIRNNEVTGKYIVH